MMINPDKRSHLICSIKSSLARVIVFTTRVNEIPFQLRYFVCNFLTKCSDYVTFRFGGDFLACYQRLNVACNPLVSWEAQSIKSMPKRDNGDSTTFRFPLLGGVSRRNCLKEYLEDNVSLGHANDALSSQFDVYKLYFTSI